MNTESMMQKFLLGQIWLKDHLGSWDIGILKAGVRVWLCKTVSLSGKVYHNQQLPCKKTVMATWENGDNIFLFWGSGDIRYSYHVGQEIVILTDH